MKKTTMIRNRTKDPQPGDQVTIISTGTGRDEDLIVKTRTVEAVTPENVIYRNHLGHQHRCSRLCWQAWVEQDETDARL